MPTEVVHEGQGYPKSVLKLQGWLEGLEAQWDQTADFTFLLARALALHRVGHSAESPQCPLDTVFIVFP